MTVLTELQSIFRDVFEDDDIVLRAETTADDVDGWDSLTHVGLILSVERHYGLRFNTTEISNMENVGELAELIAQKI
ncbi:MAG: acyl carrier protein [Robiginitomaculum sp.]|nr:MAG: acyl carrier protein [Robiginitomaculum sp.]